METSLDVKRIMMKKSEIFKGSLADEERFFFSFDVSKNKKDCKYCIFNKSKSKSY